MKFLEKMYLYKPPSFAIGKAVSRTFMVAFLLFGEGDKHFYTNCTLIKKMFNVIKISRSKLQLIEKDVFPDAWVTFIREFRKFKRIYGPGGTGFEGYYNPYKGKARVYSSKKTSLNDPAYKEAVEKLSQSFEVLRSTLRKRGSGVKPLSPEAVRLARLNLALDNIRKRLDELKEGLRSERFSTFIQTVTMNMVSEIRRFVTQVDLFVKEVNEKRA